MVKCWDGGCRKGRREPDRRDRLRRSATEDPRYKNENCDL